MDDPGVDPDEHRAALAALRQSNRLLGVDKRLVQAVDHVAPPGGGRIMELGSGGGGLLGALAARCTPSENCALFGLDRSEFALHEARTHGGGGQFSRLVAGDAFKLPFADRAFDVVVCSLLLHHFDPAGAVVVLREMARVASGAIVVGDLNRGRLAWGVTWLVTRLTSRSRLFQVDGPRSVRAAYDPAEARQLAAGAGLTEARFDRVFPFRWLMIWRRAEH